MGNDDRECGHGSAGDLDSIAHSPQIKLITDSIVFADIFILRPNYIIF